MNFWDKAKDFFGVSWDVEEKFKSNSAITDKMLAQAEAKRSSASLAQMFKTNQTVERPAYGGLEEAKEARPANDLEPLAQVKQTSEREVG